MKKKVKRKKEKKKMHFKLEKQKKTVNWKLGWFDLFCESFCTLRPKRSIQMTHNFVKKNFFCFFLSFLIRRRKEKLKF